MDPNQLDSLADMIAERIVDSTVEKVIQKIAEMGDDDMGLGPEGDDMGFEGEDDLGMEGGPGMEDDLGGEEMSPAGDMEGEQMGATGPGFLPSADAGAEPDDEDEGDDLGEDEEGDDAPEFDDEDEEGDESDEEEAPEDEEDERYFAGDKLVPGKKTVRHESHRGPQGKTMKKDKYKASPEPGVALERYSSEGVDVVRYQRIETENKRLAAELGKTRKELTRYAAGHDKMVERYNQLVGELIRRDRADELAGLVAEGYELDVDEEIARTEKYNKDEFAAHLDVIRERYRFAPRDDDFVPTGTPYPVDSDAADAQIDPYDYVRYASENPDIVRGASDEVSRAAAVIKALNAARKAGAGS